MTASQQQTQAQPMTLTDQEIEQMISAWARRPKQTNRFDCPAVFADRMLATITSFKARAEAAESAKDEAVKREQSAVAKIADLEKSVAAVTLANQYFDQEYGKVVRELRAARGLPPLPEDTVQ